MLGKCIFKGPLQTGSTDGNIKKPDDQGGLLINATFLILPVSQDG